MSDHSNTTETLAMALTDARVLTPNLVAATTATAWTQLRSWPRRRWFTAAVAAVGTFVVVGLVTAMIPNPIFGRAIATTWWAWPTLTVTAVLSGLLAASYVRTEATADTASKAGLTGGLLTFFAVGCPVCNKLALLALGYTGALTWFAPVQPFLGIAGVVLLAVALRARLKGETACPVAA